MSKKEKSLELGKVLKPKGNAFFSFDSSIKKITIEREYDGKDGLVQETLEVAPNNEYLSGAFINKYNENLKFKLDKEWITKEKYESDLAYGEKMGISSIFSVKVIEK
jgi:hypothetical protein